MGARTVKTIYSGKTKDVMLLEDGNILLKFKDTVTGTGNVIDSGANTVIGEVAGKGSASFRLTWYFFGFYRRPAWRRISYLPVPSLTP